MRAGSQQEGGNVLVLVIEHRKHLLDESRHVPKYIGIWDLVQRDHPVDQHVPDIGVLCLELFDQDLYELIQFDEFLLGQRFAHDVFEHYVQLLRGFPHI